MRQLLQLLLFGMLAALLAACGAATSVATTGGSSLAADKNGETAVNESAASETAASAAAASETAASEAAVTEEIVTTQTYVDLYEQINPSVVNIFAVTEGSPFSFNGLPDDHPELPGVPDLPEMDPLPGRGQGSGFIYDSDGHIITNNHVVDDAVRIVVTFADGTEAEAELVGADPNSDLAVIRVSDAPAALLQPIPLGDSDSLRVGQLVAAIGNPFGLEGSMSTGIISGLGRLLGGANTPAGARFSIPDIIQTDTAINPGNSGGPLLNLAGEVVGVNTAIESPVRGFAGIGYAVPSNTVQRVVPQLIAEGEISYPWLGIMGGTLSSDVAQAMDLDADQRGVLIAQVLDDSPAANAALRGSEEIVTIDGLDVAVGGDVIVQIDDQPVTEFDDLLGYLVTRTSVGQTVTLQLLRDGELVEAPVTLEARPTS